MAEQTYVGTLIGITSKPGSDWYSVEINVANLRYPVKADTKKAEIIEKVNAVGADIATWTINEVESEKINPKSNRPYINRYLEDVEAGGVIPPTADAGQPRTPTASGSENSEERPSLTKEEWRAKDSASDLRACIAIASGALQHTVPSDPSTDDLNKLNERVLHLATAWHNAVSAERDQDDLPF